MSTTSDFHDSPGLPLHYVELPITLIQSFCFNENQAKCSKCNFVCQRVTKDVLFHLTVCNGSLVEENIQQPFKLNCLMCHFKTEDTTEWRNHIFKLDHISKNFNSNATWYSHDCNLCETHFLGYEESILQHKCRPKELSTLSRLMSCVFKSFNIQHKRMMYYCTHCFHYSYDVTDLHNKKGCKAVENSIMSVCDSCQITFYGSDNNAFLNHKISSEHVMLWCLNGNRTWPKTPASLLPNLPPFMSKFFVSSSLLQQACCIACKKVDKLEYNFVYSHYIKCISSKEISTISECTPLKMISCSLCDFEKLSSPDTLYRNWVSHFKNLGHLKNMMKMNEKNLCTYYCYVSEAVFYGTKDLMIEKILLKNNDVGRLLFVAEVMTKVFRSSIIHYPNFNILHCCGICQTYTYEQSNYCRHAKHIESSELFNCSSCLVNFNVKSDYHEHLLSCEHIILKYFKPNQLSELRILEYSMETVKMNQSVLFESDDNECNRDEEESNIDSFEIKNQNSDGESYNSLSDGSEHNVNIGTEQCNRNVEIDVLSNQSCSNMSLENVEENVKACDPEVEKILNILDRLSAETNKSAFNHYLRMKFELFCEMPQAMHGFTDSTMFFCTICDNMFCDLPDWNTHKTVYHEQIELSVFYCAVCHIYHISTFYDINKHLKSTEHGVMSMFLQEWTKHSENKHKPLASNNNNNNDNSTPMEDNLKGCKEDSNKKNKDVYIEFKGVITELKENNYYSLSKLLEEKYGTFQKMSKKTNSFIIFFIMKKSVDRLIGDQEELEKQHGFKIEIIGREDDMVVLSLETVNFFTDWRLLCTQIFHQLRDIQNMFSRRKAKADKLCKSMHSLNVVSDPIKFHIFGSSVYGLATSDSDLDVYVEIGNTFHGEMSDNLDEQVNLVNKFAHSFKSMPNKFEKVIGICDTRVPIVKFYHVPTRLDCDISFKSGLSTCNSKLVNLYISMDNTVKWLVCVIARNWAVQNNLKSNSMFTSYALIWLVLFYLMVEKVVPSVAEVAKKASKDDLNIIEGWDCTFGEWSDGIKHQERYKLLLGFFQYYADKSRLHEYVLCTFAGKCMKKRTLFDELSKLSEISVIQHSKVKSLKSKIKSSFNYEHNGLAVQDPFELTFNTTRLICDKKLTDFCELCDQSVTLLKNTKGCISS